VPNPNDTPLIYTVRGNVPTDDLEHYVGWEITDDYVKFREVYKFKDDGTVAKENCHIHVLKGLPLGTEQQTFG